MESVIGVDVEQTIVSILIKISIEDFENNFVLYKNFVNFYWNQNLITNEIKFENIYKIMKISSSYFKQMLNLNNDNIEENFPTCYKNYFLDLEKKYFKLCIYEFENAKLIKNIWESSIMDFKLFLRKRCKKDLNFLFNNIFKINSILNFTLIKKETEIGNFFFPIFIFLNKLSKNI